MIYTIDNFQVSEDINMHLTLTNSQKWKQLFNILLPILVTQLALSAMTFFDTNMSGHFSSADLAGVAIGVSLWVPVQTGLNGILMVSPLLYPNWLEHSARTRFLTMSFRRCGSHSLYP